jgi:hypothetical protein
LYRVVVLVAVVVVAVVVVVGGGVPVAGALAFCKPLVLILPCEGSSSSTARPGLGNSTLVAFVARG